MPRLVRRKPLFQRLSAVLNPMDFLLWLSEELETRDWDSENVGTQLGLGLNFVFLLARANSGSAPPADDVFGNESKSLWLSLVVNSIVWTLAIFSVTNGVYTLARTRKYRMFAADIDVQPGTPSAQRVRVRSSYDTSSPFRMLASILTPETAESRAHPDKNRDVWELSVWDPLPISLRLFCLFGPAHVLVYFMFLPLASMDPRPSMTTFNTLLIQVILSAQHLLLFSKFTQQSKDNAIIQKEVMHEYDTKFVHPMQHPVVRDVGVQASTEVGTSPEGFVQTGTPTTLIRRSFKTHKNPHIDEDPTPSYPSSKASLFAPSNRQSESFTPIPAVRSSSHRNSMPPPDRVPASASTNNITMINSYASPAFATREYTPLRHTYSLNNLKNQFQQQSPRNSREMAAYEEAHRPSSPVKHYRSRKSQGTSIPETPENLQSNFFYYQSDSHTPRW